MNSDDDSVVFYESDVPGVDRVHVNTDVTVVNGLGLHVDAIDEEDVDEDNDVLIDAGGGLATHIPRDSMIIRNTDVNGNLIRHEYYPVNLKNCVKFYDLRERDADSPFVFVRDRAYLHYGENLFLEVYDYPWLRAVEGRSGSRWVWSRWRVGSFRVSRDGYQKRFYSLGVLYLKGEPTSYRRIVYKAVRVDGLLSRLRCRAGVKILCFLRRCVMRNKYRHRWWRPDGQWVIPVRHLAPEHWRMIMFVQDWFHRMRFKKQDIMRRRANYVTDKEARLGCLSRCEKHSFRENCMIRLLAFDHVWDQLELQGVVVMDVKDNIIQYLY